MINYTLTILQVLLLLCVIYFSGSFFVTSIPFVLIQMISILVIFWALLIKKLEKNPKKQVSPKGIYFLKAGPYEFIRHPIYAGLLLFASSYVQKYINFLGSLSFLLFIALLLWRISYDERLSQAYFKETYSQYKKTTKKLIPYIY